MTEKIEFMAPVCARPEIPGLYVVIPDGLAGVYWGSEYRVILESQPRPKVKMMPLQLTEYGRKWRPEKRCLIITERKGEDK